MTAFAVDQNIVFGGTENDYPGVRRIADKVKEDVKLVVGTAPIDHTPGTKAENVLLFGTIGKDARLDEMEKRGLIDLSGIRGKWDAYIFQIVDDPYPEIRKALVIAGSNKRGTIYGLFHFSELIGVSPLVWWNHVWPEKKERIILTDSVNFVSKEPSVKYRGFFINDEWPAFGTWACRHFGGVNAKCYERIFELLLRLKGNYLWPAMWDSNFNLDGPGLLNAELADEYGIVMSTSHHEPCMRSGQEYGFVRGADSPYGDAWDFNSNPEGITNFWRDGLIRNKDFENVITMGMRGENDTAIMQNATLEENIEMLRNVIRTQNRLIRETINEDLSKVPRQIVLFTEVEEFFYGSRDVKGLMGDPELDGVTLMLSDNNFGSTRTLPSKAMRGHKGGFGMYYHMDMHGGAHSFQWIGSTYLPKVWEQMTSAYDFGVREIWVTNIGDIGTQEFGLSFFLDLAYDIEKWGGHDAGITVRYAKEWVEKQFGGIFEKENLAVIESVIWDYTSLLARRKHEVMNDKVYHPVHYGEAQEVLDRSEKILKECKALKNKCPKEHMAAFISLVYYPACGTANLMKLWIISGRNQLYASQNRVEANDLAAMIPAIEDFDESLVREYMEVDDGYFNGFGLGEHIGFTTWNDEDCKYPVRVTVRPSNLSRMIVCRVDDDNYLTGDQWRDRPQTWEDFMRPDVNEVFFDIARASKDRIRFRIDTECPWISFSETEGVVETFERITVKIDRSKISGFAEGRFTVENIGHAKAQIILKAYQPAGDEPKQCFLEHEGCIAIEASHFQKKKDTSEGGFEVLKPYGRTGSAIKVYPVTADLLERVERPFVEYDLAVERTGEYELTFYLAATTPVVYERIQCIGYSVNDGEVIKENTVEDPSRQFFLSPQWTKEAYSNIKLHHSRISLVQGKNILRFYGMSPAIVLERIVIRREDVPVKESYLGPKESYYAE